MKILNTNKEELLKPLQIVTGIVERKHTLPILSNVLMSVATNQLNLYASDLEIQVSTNTKTKSDTKDTTITIGARKLLDILRSLPEQSKVTIELLGEKVVLKAGRSKFNLVSKPATEFPIMSSEDGELVGTVTLEEKKLKHMLSLVQFAMAQQDIRYYLNGILMEVKPDKVVLVGTDGHRLATVETTLGEALLGKESSLIIPRKAIIELGKLLSEGEQKVKISYYEKQVSFTFGDSQLVSKLVEGTYPDYSRVIPTELSSNFTIERLALLQALQRAAILSNERYRGVRWVLSKDMLRVVCTNTEQEEAEEELEIEYNGEPLDVGFNITYLLDVLNHTSAKEIECRVGDVNSSMLITADEEKDYRYVVMPMRI